MFTLEEQKIGAKQELMSDEEDDEDLHYKVAILRRETIDGTNLLMNATINTRMQKTISAENK